MASSDCSETLCRYFMNNVCNKGDKCPFSHDKSTHRPSNICRFYLKGECAYGSRCRYDHCRINTKKKNVTLKEYDSFAEKQALSTQKPVANSMESKYVVTNESWAEAPEFVPNKDLHVPLCETFSNNFSNKMCSQFTAEGHCVNGENCPYVHAEKCELCGYYCLNPYDVESRKSHEVQCYKEHQDEIEESFAIARSKDIVCGICMEVVYNKPLTKQKFGILSNCNHSFCLDCIREWRCQKMYQNEVKRACPECRIVSHFIVPSNYWVDDESDKEKLITSYKSHLKSKDCRYFEKGNSVCPFGPNCFYRHVLPDGTPAPPQPLPRRQQNADGISRILDVIRMSDFLTEREDRVDELLDSLREDLFEDLDDELSFILLAANIIEEL